MTPEDENARRVEVERGHLAKQITDNPLWAETLNGYETALLARMVDPAATDDQALEARKMVVVVRRVRRDIEAILTTGKLALMQLEEAKDGR